MTEQEAVEVINNYKFDCVNPGTLRMTAALGVAASCVNELRQYREIGTVEKFQQLAEQFKPHAIDGASCPERNCNRCDRYRKENEGYHEAGTIEECQAARELQEARTPRPVMLAGGRKGYECPNCGDELYVNSFNGMYCHWCGKKLDWDRSGIKEGLF